jgi:hypothetical protein
VVTWCDLLFVVEGLDLFRLLLLGARGWQKLWSPSGQEYNRLQNEGLL